jgi:hypothetical protein
VLRYAKPAGAGLPVTKVADSAPAACLNFGMTTLEPVERSQPSEQQ